MTRKYTKRPVLTCEEVRRLFHYDPMTGAFTWREGNGSTRKAGDMVGTITVHGYWQSCIGWRSYRNCRLAWLYVYGEWPKQNIDHINGNRLDDRIENLRDVSDLVNLQNMRKPMKHSKSGVLGAALLKCGTYQVTICVNHKRIYLGRYKTAAEAHKVYVDAKRNLHEGNTL